MKLAPKKFRDQEALKKTAYGFKEQLAAAEKLADPADRIEALLNLKNDIGRQAFHVHSGIYDRSDKFDIATILGTLGGSIGGGVAIAVLVNPILGFGLLIGGVAAGMTISLKGLLTDRIEKGALNELKDHFDSLNESVTKAAAGIDDLLKTKSNEIAASEKFSAIYDRFPEVRDSFIKTFNQAAARNALQSAPPAPNPNPPKFAL